MPALHHLVHELYHNTSNETDLGETGETDFGKIRWTLQCVCTRKQCCNLVLNLVPKLVPKGGARSQSWW